jgi:hypothetical protein
MACNVGNSMCNGSLDTIRVLWGNSGGSGSRDVEGGEGKVREKIFRRMHD